MKEPDWKNCTEEQAWMFIAAHLSKRGISTVLVGGAVAAIYSEGVYKSGDLDFVVENYIFNRLPEYLSEIGFTKKESRHYQHPNCKHLIIEFQSPPVAIGDDVDIKTIEKKTSGGIIKILSPTDCIRDRLASYIHFNARECLDQAVLVAKAQQFNINKVKKWCVAEGAESVFEEFRDLFRKK